MQSVNFTIKGMTCSGCAKSVSAILLGIEGVDSAIVNFEQHRAEIEFDEQQTNTQALISALDDGGFEAALAP